MELENDNSAMKKAGAISGVLFVLILLIYAFYLPRMQGEFYAIRSRNLFLTCIPMVIFVYFACYKFIKTPSDNKETEKYFFVPSIILLSFLIILIPAAKLFDVGIIFLFAAIAVIVAHYFAIFLFKSFMNKVTRSKMDTFRFLVLFIPLSFLIVFSWLKIVPFFVKYFS